MSSSTKNRAFWNSTLVETQEGRLIPFAITGGICDLFI